MNKPYILGLSLVAALLASPAFARDPSGRLTSVDGGVLIQRDLKTDVARVGSILGVGDTVVTTDTGAAQWQMTDDALFVIGADSGVKINRFEMPAAGATNGVAAYTLVQGSAHALTGKIGSTIAANTSAAPQRMFAAYRALYEPGRLIKVAGPTVSPYSLQAAFGRVTSKGADFALRQTAKSLAVLVHKGALTVCNIAGCASPGAGFGVLVNCVNCKPLLVPNFKLGLDILFAELSFKGVDRVIDFEAGIHDPRIEPAPPPGQNCVDVSAQLQAGTCVPGGPGVPPVSPN